MRFPKKVLSLILSMIMVFCLLPATVFAVGVQNVYISASDDGQFITDQNGDKLAYHAVSLDKLAQIDLDTYGLSDYIYDEDGDGTPEITALHLYIYVHETLTGNDWSDVTVTGGAGSIYFAGGLFGFEDENLRYNYNGAYPADENGWGFTADRIVLSAGDYFDVAHYSDWNFYADSAYGFHYFTDSNDEITLEYTVEAESELTTKLVLVGGGMGMGDVTNPEAGYTVYYGQSIGSATDSVTTDDTGTAAITFPSAGTWYVWCDGGEGIDAAAGAIVSSPASAVVKVTEKEGTTTPEQPSEPTQPDGAQDVSEVLDATMAQMAATVTAPAFGTNAGEWTVLTLARGGYYEKDNAYFTDYYDRIVETVNTKAASVNLNGALHKSKSTDNSRLIVALASIGKDATSVGDWNLITPYEDFTWIKKQGINGVIWALIALDSNDYQTTDTTIRQQCVDYLLEKQLEDGGWTLSGTEADPDITGMALQALYRYRDQEAVAAAAEEAFDCLSWMQQDNGGFLYGTSETSESAAQVIVACTTWGINPDTDSRFVKSEGSAVDALLAYYVENEAMFEHQLGAGTNDMATDQAGYALVAYDRLLNNQPSLYNFSDVTFGAGSSGTADEMTAYLGLPAEVNPGAAFNGIVSIDRWNNTAGYKLIDMIIALPAGVGVTGVTASDRLAGGEVSYNLETMEDGSGKLRIVYFDANENTDLTVSGEEFPAELFTINFTTDAAKIPGGTKIVIAITGMSVKLHSDSSAEDAMIIVNIGEAAGEVAVVGGISFSAVCLYEGDDVDLIPSTKKAIAVAVTGIDNGIALLYQVSDEKQIIFKYSGEITEKSGVATYVAMVDNSIAVEDLVKNTDKFILGEGDVAEILFGNINGDSVINAQDALAAVNAWLRVGEAPDDDTILTMNVNGDSRINTFDALGIVENFVNGSTYGVVTKAATITTAADTNTNTDTTTGTDSSTTTDTTTEQTTDETFETLNVAAS